MSEDSILCRKRILVVEDELIVAMDLQKRLTHLGYDVPLTASSGDEAIQLVFETKPHLILMDIRLKGALDGIKTAQVIRDRFQTPVVYLTCYCDESTIERAKLTEPYGYLVKPFDERELKTTIEMALHRNQKELERKEIMARAIVDSSRAKAPGSKS